MFVDCVLIVAVLLLVCFMLWCLICCGCLGSDLCLLFYGF